MTTPKTLTLALPPEAMEIVLTGLAELPYRIAHPIMSDAQTQFTQQLSADNAAPTTPPAPAA